MVMSRNFQCWEFCCRPGLWIHRVEIGFTGIQGGFTGPPIIFPHHSILKRERGGMVARVCGVDVGPSGSRPASLRGVMGE